MKTSWTRVGLWALVLVGAALVGAPSEAWAEDGEGAPAGDLKERIRQQMEKIRTLMQDNENALLELSAGERAQPKKVDVDVPPQPKAPKGSGGGDDGSAGQGSAGQGSAGQGSAGQGSAGQGSAGGSGEGARKAIEELLRKQQESGEPIPDEITRLVKMIPL